MKAGEKIFIFGKQPSFESGMMRTLSHSLDEKIKVRFVKHPYTEKLYFNFADFLKPYKNPKYKKVILNIIPKGYRKLNKVWMNIEAWKEIKNGIDEGKEKDIITGWKERFLF